MWVWWLGSIWIAVHVAKPRWQRGLTGADEALQSHWCASAPAPALGAPHKHFWSRCACSWLRHTGLSSFSSQPSEPGSVAWRSGLALKPAQPRSAGVMPRQKNPSPAELAPLSPHQWVCPKSRVGAQPQCPSKLTTNGVAQLHLTEPQVFKRDSRIHLTKPEEQ